MNNNRDLIQKDLQHIWHPGAHMKDFEQYPPLVVHKAKGSYLYTDQGTLIDAISSWWCKSLGHGHPAILAAIKKQLDNFEHIIAANTTHPLLVELGEKLAALSNKQQVFFASDGSSAVEIALKLALHATQLKGKPERNAFIALKNSYHGETFATLSVSDIGIFKKPYEGYGPDCYFIENLPYVKNREDPLWNDAEAHWQLAQAELERVKANACALILEPIIQGAAGMQCYSADFLKRLACWAKSNDIYLIADEIMTGMCRTGKWFAYEHAGISPDLICLSKGLTSGSIPFSCVLIDKAIYQLFYHEYDKDRSFLHSHTYSGNALAISAALATIEVMQQENINEQATESGKIMSDLFHEVATATGKLTNIRQAGAMVAGDLQTLEGERIGYRLRQEGVKQGLLLRPIGHSLYWLPPLNTDKDTLLQLAERTARAIKASYEPV